MCCLPVTADARTLVEHGEVIHLACHLGLLDAGAAIARLLRQHPGHPLCATCIGAALTVTQSEAEEGVTRLRPLRGFAVRYDTCVGCGRRRQAIRAVRTLGTVRSRGSLSA